MNVTLIVPCFNETANLQKGVLDKIGNFTENDARFTQVLIVDDGSSDESVSIIKEKYLQLFPKFKLLDRPHEGKALTVIAGIKAATTEWVMFSDMDLATPIEEANKLIEHMPDAEVVIGSRGADRPDAPLTRQIMAKGMIFVRSTFFGLKGIKDTQCGFKLFRHDAAMKIISKLRVFSKKPAAQNASVSAAFDLEFLFVARLCGYRIIEVPVTWRHVETRRVDFVKDTIESLHDLTLLKWYQIKGLYGQTH